MKRLLSVLLAVLLATALLLGAQAEDWMVEEDPDEALEQVEQVGELNILLEEGEEALFGAEEGMPPEEIAGPHSGAAEAAAVSNAASTAISIDSEHFPDDFFRSYVRNELDLNGDGELSEKEREAVDSLEFVEEELYSIKGIEYFPNLESLVCETCELTSLDVSKCTKLEKLSCFDNYALTTLNVSKCTDLEYLKCDFTDISSLDVSNCPKLQSLDIECSSLSKLDVSNCPKLEVLYCGSNSLTSLDVSGHTELEALSCNYNGLKSLKINNCPKLRWVQTKENKLSEIDITGSKTLIDLINSQEPYFQVHEETKVITFVDSEEDDWSLIDATSAMIADGKVLCGPLSYATIEVEDQTYNNGKALKPAVTVKLGDRTLKKGTDYTVAYSDNKAIGKAKVTVKGKGKYTGTGTTSFAIKPIDLSECEITVEDQVYTGATLKPEVTVRIDSMTLEKGTDYTVAYKNNKAVGAATVTIKGKGKYAGTAKATFAINPNGLNISKLKAGKKKLTVNWKKQKDITGYQIQYSLKKDFSSSKTVTVNKAKTTSATIKKLKAKKKYCVRIRAYKTVKKVKYYSEWSAVKSIKTK